MQIVIKLFASLRHNRFAQTRRDYATPPSVAQVTADLDIPAEMVGIILINGRHAGRQDVLQEGDILSLLPLIGGG